jgi:5-methylcytosine-specific restriction endonuclease McrA
MAASEMSSNPSSKWFWNDWENDAALRLCGLAAQGLWMRMLSVCSRSVPVGYCAVNGSALDTAGLARLTGNTEPEIAGLVHELEFRGVFSRDRRGVIYNRRMVRDAKIAAAAQKNGALGGHPNIRRGAVAKADRQRRFRRSDSPQKSQRIFDRDGGKCHWCGIPLSDPSDPIVWHIDHVLPIADGGGNEETNLVAACAKCNGERSLINRPYGRNETDLKLTRAPPLLPLSLSPSSLKEEEHPPPPQRTKPPRGDDPDFVEMWVCYPKKDDKGHARIAYRAARKKADAATILAGVKRYCEKSRDTEKKFIPLCSTWLEGERWNDEDIKSNGLDVTAPRIPDRGGPSRPLTEDERRRIFNLDRS